MNCTKTPGTVHIQSMYGSSTVQVQFIYSSCTIHVQYKYCVCTDQFVCCVLGAERPVLDWVAYCGMPPAGQLVWEERGNNLNKAMLFLTYLKNGNAKNDLNLAYSQGNIVAYPFTIKLMARYLSTQYSNKNSANQRNVKRWDKSGKEENTSKSQDKDSTTAGTAGEHVDNTTPAEEFSAPSGGASIGAHLLEANEMSSRPSGTVEEILGVHLIGDDDFWGWNNPSDVSVNTANSTEIMAGSHITEQCTLKYQEFSQPELLNMTS